MTVRRWALSAFFVWHIAATAVGAFGSASAVRPITASDRPPADALAAYLTPVFDRWAVSASSIPGAVERLSKPVRWAIDSYLLVTGLGQNWKMFSVPPRVHQYMRVRYFVGRPADTGDYQPQWTATELVMPAHREDVVRLLQSYRDSFRDKAMAIAHQNFVSGRKDVLLKPDTKSAELPDDLAPIARYFGRRFERRALRPGEQVVRTEVWFGTAPMRPPGSSTEDELVQARWEVLRTYYGGPVERHFGRPLIPTYRATEQEADIEWVLEYFEP
jgi:hypothetical protein